jgi:serine/threonine protein phosphatase PrpC
MQMKAWRVSACSVQGVSHIKTDQPCQDANEWRVKDSVLLAAIADGAGSAKESQRGATLACRTAIELLASEFPVPANKSTPELFDFLRKAFSAAREAILAEAKSSNLPIRELSCTLILVATWEDGAVAAQIGDGAALILKPTGEMEALTRPAHTEYLNETTFITAEDALASLQTNSYSGEIKSLAMFTDGLQMLALKMPDALPHEPFFSPLMKFIEAQEDDVMRQDQLQKFLASPRITDRADDDLTLLLATLV